MRLLLSTGLAGALATSSLSAAVISQAFNQPEGGLPEGWGLRFTGNGSNHIAEVSEFPSGGARLLQRRTTSLTGNSFIYYNGSDAGITNGQLSDFSGSVTFNMEGLISMYYRGVTLRAQSTVYTNAPTYYVSFSSTSLRITLNPPDHTSGGSVLATSDLSSALTANTDYQLRFSALGTTLGASIYAWDTSTSGYNTLLGSVSYTDSAPSAYASGYFGFRSNFGNSSRVYWSDLEITTIPEPGLVGLLAISLGVVGLYRRHRAFRID